MHHRSELDTLKALQVHDVQFVGAAKLLDEEAEKATAEAPDQCGTVAHLREQRRLL